MLEVGANTNVSVLETLDAREKWIADPYEGMAGSWIKSVPDLGPGYHISRCVIGETSNALPSDFFDLIFSVSVLEHIGQRAAGFDCRFTANPPEGQEKPRDSFCAECYRILKPGGVTIHTIDHAVRNVSYDRNFRKAGFAPLLAGESIDVEAMMEDDDALRQSVTWSAAREPMPPERTKLHSVLLAGYRKPVGAPTTWASVPQVVTDGAPALSRSGERPATPASPTPVVRRSIVERALAKAKRVAGRERG